MKQFACGDVVPGCHAQWTLATDDEILTALGEHAASAHGLVDLPLGLAAHIRSKITTVI